MCTASLRGSGVQALAQLTSLRQLSLYGCVDCDAHVLGTLSALTGLTRLHVPASFNNKAAIAVATIRVPLLPDAPAALRCAMQCSAMQCNAVQCSAMHNGCLDQANLSEASVQELQTLMTVSAIWAQQRTLMTMDF